MSSTTLVEAAESHILTNAPGISSVARDCHTFVDYWKDQPKNSGESAENRKDLPFHERKIAYRTDSAASADHKAIVVRDIRGHENEYSIDQQGFQLCKLQTKNADFSSDENIKAIYYPEVEELLKKLTGAHHILVYDHVVRNQSYESALAAPPDDTTVDIPGPARRVHIDDTPSNARRMIRDFLPTTHPSHSTLINASFCIINTWRPLSPIRRDPLGLIDSRTIRPQDRQIRALPAPEEMGGDYEIFALTHNPDHRWHFARGQDVHEALCFKIYDSRDEAGFMGVGHCSFVDEESLGERDRESVEVRSVCFF